MIKSEIIKIKKNIIDNSYIEKELSKTFSDIVRWAVVDIDDEFITVCVSFCKNS